MQMKARYRERVGASVASIKALLDSKGTRYNRRLGLKERAYRKATDGVMRATFEGRIKAKLDALPKSASKATMVQAVLEAFRQVEPGTFIEGIIGEASLTCPTTAFWVALWG